MHHGWKRERLAEPSTNKFGTGVNLRERGLEITNIGDYRRRVSARRIALEPKFAQLVLFKFAIEQLNVLGTLRKQKERRRLLLLDVRRFLIELIEKGIARFLFSPLGERAWTVDQLYF